MSDAGHPRERPSRGLLDRAHRLLTWLFAVYLLAAGAIAATAWSALPWAVSARASGLAGLVLGAGLVACSGLAACLMANGARRGTTPVRFRRIHLHLVGTGRFAQGVLVPVLAALAGLAAWGLRGAPDSLPDPALATTLGGLTALLAFPALVAERFVAATPEAALPEAPALRRLLGLPVAVFILAGLLEVLRGQEFAWAGIAATVLAGFVAAIAVELAVRGLLRWFQPPADPALTRARVDSLLADIPGWGFRKGGMAEPLRTHFGLDFSRSWALAFLRRALAPAALLTLLACWGLSGVVLLPMDSRGVYERFGAPVAVFGPGLHGVLPWPLGQFDAHARVGQRPGMNRAGEAGTHHEHGPFGQGRTSAGVPIGSERGHQPHDAGVMATARSATKGGRSSASTPSSVTVRSRAWTTMPRVVSKNVAR